LDKSRFWQSSIVNSMSTSGPSSALTGSGIYVM
jgi:hypothetical protein